MTNRNDDNSCEKREWSRIVTGWHKPKHSIDASGLATLAFCATRFKDVGGRVVCLNSRRPDRPDTDILQSNTSLETYQEELDAVTAFFPAVLFHDMTSLNSSSSESSGPANGVELGYDLLVSRQPHPHPMLLLAFLLELLLSVWGYIFYHFSE
jgi:hypothetical protein